MKSILSLAAAALLAASPAALAQSSDTTQPNTVQEVPKTASQPMQEVDTATFVTMASSSNMFEIESSQLALEKAQSDTVKQFAQQMVADHTKAGEDFKAALQQANMAAPEPALQPKEQQALEKLQAASGEQFDAEYVAAQARAHDEAVALFRGYASGGDDPALMEFAKQTLPVLEMHQQRVKELQG